MECKESPLSDNKLMNGETNYQQRELLFKILVIGDYGVGKTATVRRYSEGKFSSTYKITIGADFAIKQLQWDSRTKVNLQLWDIAGHERFGYMTRVYYKYAVGAAIVFDLSRVASFHSVKKWLNDVREKVCLPDERPIPVVLLANKCDVPGLSVPTDQLARLCRDCGLEGWFATSAKENINIDDAMNFLVEQIIRMKTNADKPNGSFTVHDTKYQRLVQKKQNKICCG